ncbi:transcriptional repressor [Candidatus Woesearchaeota archaeon]|nr:transcriptional repressor [Candidatus Woesearchaeota archaeon]
MIKKQVKTRNTIQRIKIMKYLKSVKTHPTAEMVYNAVVKEIPSITLATVYRNLHNLANKGKILMFEFNKEYHFDGDTCNHQHCICKKCGKITDVFQEEISKYALSKLRADNFDAKCVTIIFNGFCRKCSGV